MSREGDDEDDDDDDDDDDDEFVDSPRKRNSPGSVRVEEVEVTSSKPCKSGGEEVENADEESGRGAKERNSEGRAVGRENRNGDSGGGGSGGCVVGVCVNVLLLCG